MTKRRSRFQKRHYVALASALKRAKARPTDSVQQAIADLQADLCDLFASDNPEFRRATFESACTPKMEGAR
jgi:hypothetical protein